MAFPIVVTGPTASGKSALGLRLAAEFRTDIISADSVLVYRGADIGSAKPTLAERQAVAHHLVDVAELGEPYNAGRFLREASATEERLKTLGKRSLIVGGTTLYISAYVDGLADLPAANEQVRQALRQQELGSLYAELERRDPQRARQLHPNDRLRIERALETLQLSGLPVSSRLSLQIRKRRQAIILVLLWDRDELYRRINLRTAEMLQAGLLEETAHIVEQAGVSAPVLQALGYRQALEVLSGRLPKEDLGEAVAQYTRNFAKRQMTYWRNEPCKRGWVVSPTSEKSSFCRTLSAGQALNQREKRKDFVVLSLGFSELLERLDQGIGENECQVWMLDAQRLL